jgi:asparagine synthetase B (glutamine-hydrolysing)
MSETMAAPWILRWDTGVDVTPTLIYPTSAGRRGPSRLGAQNSVVLEGYLFDREELATRPEEPDAGVVAQAYRRWGEGLFEKLRGAFTLAIWDDDRRRLLVGRDAVGLGPCFYHWHAGVFLLSSSLDALLAEPEVDARIDRVVMAEYLQNTPATHQVHETFYAGVRRLPSAHALSLREGRLSIRRYWDPVPPGFTWASAEEMAQFPDLLGRAVRRCLAAGADCLGLSGGFDSIGLAALAAEQSPGGRPLQALSLRFIDSDCDESERQMAVARALRMPHLLLTPGESLGGQSLMEGVGTVSATSHCPVISMWEPAYSGLLRTAADRGLRGLMMGTGGDDLLCVDLSYGADCLASGDLRRLWRFYHACRRTSAYPALRIARAVFWHGALDPALHRLVGSTLGFISPAGTEWLRKERRRRAAVRPWLSRADAGVVRALEDRRSDPIPVEMAPGEGAYVRVIRYLSQAPMLQLEMEQGALFIRSLGLDLFLPYFDRDVMELLLRMRPEHLIDGGYHKGPLRRLVGERLPMIDPRAKKMDAGGLAHQVLRSQGATRWRDLGGSKMLTELDLVDPRLVQVFMDDYFARRNDNALQAWLFLSAEMWLQARCRVGAA